MQINFPDMRIRCERSTFTSNGRDFVVGGLILVNAFLNLVNDNLEDGNTFSEEILMPPLKLKIYSRAPTQ
jgi:hypothetical protein